MNAIPYGQNSGQQTGASSCDAKEGRGLLKLALGAWLWLKIQEDIRIQLRRRLLISANVGSWESLSCSVQMRTFQPLGPCHHPVDAIILSERWSLGTSWLCAAEPSQLRWCGSWCLLLMLPGFSPVGAKPWAAQSQVCGFLTSFSTVHYSSVLSHVQESRRCGCGLCLWGLWLVPLDLAVM